MPILASGSAAPAPPAPPRRRLGTDHWGVVRLDVVAGLDDALQLDRAAADVAAARSARQLGVLVLVVFVLVVVVVVVVVERALVAEQLRQPGQPVRHVPDRGAGDDEQPVAADQAEQRRRDPGRQPLRQRPRGHHADEAARGLDRGPAAVVVREGGHPAGDAEQAEPADQQRGPADLGRREGRIAVRVAEEPPADQREQDRDGERALAHDRARERVDALAGQVVHPRPDRRGEHDREPEEEQADAVSLVIGLEFAGVAAEPAHGGADRPRDQQPDRADGAVEPARQDHHRVLGRGRRRRAAPGRRPLLGRRRLGGSGPAGAARTAGALPLRSGRPAALGRSAAGARPGAAAALAPAAGRWSRCCGCPLPDRLAVVRAADPVLRPAPPPAPAAAARAPPDRAVPPEPRLAPRGGVLGRITSGDSSL